MRILLEAMKAIGFITRILSQPKYFAIFVASSIVLILVFGVPTALITVPFIHYKRMISATPLDYFFLFSTSLLLAVFIILNIYKEKSTNKCNYYAFGGTILGFLSFACPTCNLLLVSLFGVSALTNYFEPLRIPLGIISLIALILAIRLKVKASIS